MVSERSNGQRNGAEVRLKENIGDTVISFIWLNVFSFTPCCMVLSTAAYYRIGLPSATALTSFLRYNLISGQRLTVSKAFTSISLFSKLQTLMTMLPKQLFAFLHGTSLTSVHLCIPIYWFVSQPMFPCNVSRIVQAG